MIIKILGSGCNRCITLTDNTRAALTKLEVEAQVLKVTDFAEIVAHGVMSTPARVIDDKVVSVGKVLSGTEIEALLKA
jgi:small redox-active disulfide protein 2